ncbi:MAG: type II toxin-antitoxin system VapC family toxin [Bryobacteraceae bacterium]
MVDASTALAWCFPDESSDYADGVLTALEGRTILVPALWNLEIANAILVGERRNRLRKAEIRQFAALLEALSLVQDMQPVGEHLSNVLPLARKYGLSAYDAAYLELSIRRRAPLATLDGKLLAAARQAGVKPFAGEEA